MKIPDRIFQDGGNSTGFPLLARNVDPSAGVRSYAATGYFAPNIGKSNLILLTGAQATKINFKKSKGKIIAAGVDYVFENTTYSVSAQKEIILAAGESITTVPMT